ncbi:MULTISPECIES: gamma carbonic anhydrase family protein [unclassified Neisseria]|uniref:gamma carbonic anhydrase family protein n=1 Tax=unclassified Neisseria TaxID=2623750 RepID=UPI0010729B8F|nr:MULTISPECIES: gamma carbonic anhydrase family protein [unclassified Neisseria]MBF0803135.1 gamma carbonic anhydrase family protein [Neisseria sp. 19428wB4_WF04]TFU44257.1 gamma carbonic anhydrase family protein [Neisseria sp. WF04]
MTNIRPYLAHYPKIDPSCYIDPAAAVIGEVSLAENVSVWPFAVLRGDVNRITIGARSNVQDLSMLHVSHKTPAKPAGSPLVVGEDVTIGHKAMLHGCTIGNRVLVGMGTVILDDAVVEDDVMIGAGSLVAPRKRLESGYLYVGSPVKQVRALTDEEKAFLVYSAEHYMRVSANYKNAESGR